MTDVVPIVTSFEEIYHDEAVSDQRRRWELVLAVFKKEYGEPAQFISRSPGRVNLIGEVCGALEASSSGPLLTCVAAHRLLTL